MPKAQPEPIPPFRFQNPRNDHEMRRQLRDYLAFIRASPATGFEKSRAHDRLENDLPQALLSIHKPAFLADTIMERAWDDLDEMLDEQWNQIIPEGLGDWALPKLPGE